MDHVRGRLCDIIFNFCEILIGYNWLMGVPIDFCCLQLTFDVCNWVYSKHMIHYNKVNWKIFAKYFLKIFPIDFQSPIDFSQLHMIRPQIIPRYSLPSPYSSTTTYLCIICPKKVHSCHLASLRYMRTGVLDNLFLDRLLM